MSDRADFLRTRKGFPLKGTRASIAMIALLALRAAAAQGFEECGELGNSYGPYDYRTERSKLAIVEGAHFTADVELLRKGNTGTLGGDIDYTLRASPNHHRALISMMNLGRRLKTDQPLGAKYSIPCYLDRAIRFAPNDASVRLIYGTYLARSAKKGEAVKQLELAATLEEANANVHYNLGLIYLELKDVSRASMHAKRAYELGFTLPGLRKMLIEAGQPDPAAGTPLASGPGAKASAAPK